MDHDVRTVLVVEDEPHIRDLVGLHLDLGEWAYRDGDWVSLYQVVPTATLR